MADEKHESKRNCHPRQKWLPVAAILLLIFLAVGFSVQYISFVSQTIYQESTSHLEEVLHKSNNMLKEMVRKNLTYLHLYNGFLESTSDEAEIQAYIRAAQQEAGFAEFYFLTYDGNYMTVTGKTGYLGLQTNLDEELADGNDIVMNTALPGKPQMLAFICPETQGSYRGFAYDAVAITYYNDEVLRLLDNSAFQGNASNYVIYPDGRVVIDNSVNRTETIYNFVAIFSMALNGIGAHKIARILNDEKIPSPTAYKQLHGIHYRSALKNTNAALWSSPTVYQILHDQLYIGNMVQGKHKKISYKSEKTIWLPKSQWIVVENTHEAIIEREMFETVQRMMQERTRSGEKGTIHPLAKKVVCGCCGSCMEQTGRQPRADGTQRRYVRCRMHQRAPEVCGNKTCTDMDALENAVLERIRAYAADYFDPEKVTLPEQDDPIRQREQARRDELKRLKSEAARRRKAMQELYLDKVSGLIDAVQFSEMNQTFLEEVKKAETRIDTLETELEQQQEETGGVQTQMQRVRELAQVSYLTRELVVLLVHRVIVSPKDTLTGEQKITIEWNF